MPSTHDLVVTIAADITGIKSDLGEMKTELACLHTEVDTIQLKQAKLEGALDMLKYLVTLIGLSGIAALIKAFMK